MSTSISATCVLTPEGAVGPATVRLDGGRIAEISPTPDASVDVDLLAPGFVDLQVNGIGEHDVGDEATDWDSLDAALIGQGVTTWFPTLTSRPLEEYPAPLERIAEAARRGGPRPRIAGVHLEGPFLAPEYARAHPVENLAAVDGRWLATLPPVVRLVTLAPELPGALEAIATLAGRGVVVALGHSGADVARARAAADAGASLVTHLFNAMAPIHHRRPGLAGAALTDDRLTVALVADLVHTAPEMLALAFSAKDADHTALVTDATAAGSNHLHGAIEVVEGAPRLPDGTIAGSVLTMDRAVANVVEHTGVPLERAVVAATATPARVLGLDDRGRIEVGTRADLVALGPDLTVTGVWIGGRQAFG